MMKWDWIKPFSIQHSIINVIQIIKSIKINPKACAFTDLMILKWGGQGSTNNNGCKVYKDCETKLEDTKQ